MKILYSRLFNVDLRHTYYADADARDIVVKPTPGCQQLLNRLGLIFQRSRSSFSVVGEVEPGTDPPLLRRPFEKDTVVFRFYLRLGEPRFLNTADLPEHDRTTSLFYFNNLRDDREESRRYLGDSIVDARLGDAIRTAFGPIYTYSFDAPVQRATLELRDMFGQLKLQTALELPRPGDTVDRFQLDLSAVEKISPGRYVLSDDHGGEQTFYYDPTLSGEDVFGLVEIYNKTDTFTPDNSDRVPEAYRFWENDEITSKGNYALEFAPRSTIWRYIVTKKYDTNGIVLDNLSVAGGIAFTRSSDGNRVIFTSDAAVPLQERPQALQLEHDGTDILNLPSPGVKTPLQRNTAAGPYRSDMYIYI